MLRRQWQHMLKGRIGSDVSKQQKRLGTDEAACLLPSLKN